MYARSSTGSKSSTLLGPRHSPAGGQRRSCCPTIPPRGAPSPGGGRPAGSFPLTCYPRCAGRTSFRPTSRCGWPSLMIAPKLVGFQGGFGSTCRALAGTMVQAVAAGALCGEPRSRTVGGWCSSSCSIRCVMSSIRSRQLDSPLGCGPSLLRLLMCQLTARSVRLAMRNSKACSRTWGPL